jgi:haloalkane dehalogenase
MTRRQTQTAKLLVEDLTCHGTMGVSMSVQTAVAARLPERLAPLYPFDDHGLELSCGHRLHYVDEGTGPVLLMVHGNPNWSFYYRNLISGLRDTYRCIAVDHIGCGLSDKPENYSYRIGDHADNLVELIEHLGLKDITLIGHDWGGSIGLRAAQLRPNQFTRFAFFNTAAFLLPLPRLLTVLRMPGIGPLFVRGLNVMVWAGMVTGDRSKLKGAVRAGYLFPYDSWANRVAVQRFVEEIPIETSHHNYALLTDLEAWLPAVADKPMLVGWGLRDPVFHPGYFAEWKRRFPRAEFHAFDDTGHWLLEEVPERIVPLMRGFLERA